MGEAFCWGHREREGRKKKKKEGKNERSERIEKKWRPTIHIKWRADRYIEIGARHKTNTPFEYRT